MLCNKCIFVNKTFNTDVYGNLHINWMCDKRFMSIYYQVNYNDHFLSQLRSGEIFFGDVIVRGILPKGKRFNDIELVEVLFNRDVKECKDFREKLVELSRFFQKNRVNVS